jgi:hypothetical protein
MAQLLVVAAISGDEKTIKKILNKVEYYLRRNYIAYKCHSKKKIKMVMIS